jgi:hypothetical protein
MSLEFATELDGRILNVTISGKLTKEDYEHFTPETERLVRQHGKIAILFQMHDFHGWTAAALWEDTKFAMHHFHDIARLAVVGEKSWQKGMATFCKPFTKAEVRYFESSDVEKAKVWLRAPSEIRKGN